MKIYPIEELCNLSASHPAVKFFRPCASKGIRAFVSNLHTQLSLIELEGQYIPVTINETEYENPYIVSNYYPAAYRCEQYAAHPFKRFMAEMMGLGLKSIQINKVVTLGNWLMTTNPMIQGSLEFIKKITHFASELFPKHLIAVRSIPCGEEAIWKHAGYHIFKARDIWCYDPHQPKSSRAAYHRRRDLRLKEEFECVNTFTASDWETLITLYQEIYIKKHTRYAPDYTPLFFQSAYEQKLLSIHGLKREGEFVGFYGSWSNHQRMAVPLFGYHPHKTYQQHIYRLLTALILEESDAKKTWLNEGTGGDVAKSSRGLTSQVEYAAIFSRHLPLGRRTFWKCASLVAQ